MYIYPNIYIPLSPENIPLQYWPSDIEFIFPVVVASSIVSVSSGCQGIMIAILVDICSQYTHIPYV